MVKIGVKVLLILDSTLFSKFETKQKRLLKSNSVLFLLIYVEKERLYISSQHKLVNAFKATI